MHKYTLNQAHAFPVQKQIIFKVPIRFFIQLDNPCIKCIWIVIWYPFFFFIWLLLFFSHSAMSISLWPHRPQHTRLPCPSPSPGACSNSCPMSQWCHPTISFSAIPFSSCLQSFPASESFPVSQFASDGQSIGASTSASVLSMNNQNWYP